jgi:hypothetical protein
MGGMVSTTRILSSRTSAVRLDLDKCPKHLLFDHTRCRSSQFTFEAHAANVNSELRHQMCATSFGGGQADAWERRGLARSWVRVL